MLLCAADDPLHGRLLYSLVTCCVRCRILKSGEITEARQTDLVIHLEVHRQYYHFSGASYLLTVR